jgi:hypothetical protein
MAEAKSAAPLPPPNRFRRRACSIRSSKKAVLAKEPARERGKDLVKEFVAQVLDGSMTVPRMRR